MRTVLLVNPQAGGGAAGKQLATLEQRLKKQLGAFEILETQRAGHGRDLCRRALRDGAEKVVVLGGDGSLGDAVSGFFEDGKPVKSGAEMALLPYGTGGDFRRTLKLPKDLAEAAQVAAEGVVRSLDVGRLDYTDLSGQTKTRYF